MQEKAMCSHVHLPFGLAFFPGDSDVWEKPQRALKAQIDPQAFERMRRAVSSPFQPGEHQPIAVKVIDFRGNGVLRVMNLDGGQYRWDLSLTPIIAEGSG